MALLAPAASAVFWGVVTFSLLVVLHEGGHFLAARLFGVKVHEFMIGLPGPALRLKTKSTAYGITAVPLGGYVRIAGMEPGAEDPLLADALWQATSARRITADGLAQALGIDTGHADKILTTLADWGAIEPAEDDDAAWDATMEARPDEDANALLGRARSVTYRGKKTWQRLVMLAAGVVVNLLAAMLTFTIVLSLYGYYEPALRIDTVAKGSAAAKAGLRHGDRMVAIDGDRLKDWNELITVLQRRKPGQSITVTYARSGEQTTVPAVLGNADGKPRLGVSPSVVHRDFNVFTGFVESLRWTGMVFVAIGDFFRPSTFQTSIKGARSVIGISEEVAKAVKQGPLDYAWLVAFLSLSLGVMNILPIPPLDGGKAAMEIVEAALGHPLKREVYLAVSAAGAILLFSLIAYLMYADVVRIATGG